MNPTVCLSSSSLTGNELLSTESATRVQCVLAGKLAPSPSQTLTPRNTQ